MVKVWLMPSGIVLCMDQVRMRCILAICMALMMACVQNASGTRSTLEFVCNAPARPENPVVMSTCAPHAVQRFTDWFGKAVHEVSGRSFASLTSDPDTVLRVFDMAQVRHGDLPSNPTIGLSVVCQGHQTRSSAIFPPQQPILPIARKERTSST